MPKAPTDEKNTVEKEKYWLRRKRHGTPKKIETSNELWELACDYFQQCEDNPWIKKDFRGNQATEVEYELTVPFTWSGLEAYVFEKTGLVRLDDYKSNKGGRYNDFADIVHAIGVIISTQKFTGAVVGEFNANIIARDLGLSEKKEIEVNDLREATDEELEEELSALRAAAKD